jgi:hypothetical protein
MFSTKVVSVLALSGALLLSPSPARAEETPANCGMSETTGCLNGNAYNYLDKKVCGQTLHDRQEVVRTHCVCDSCVCCVVFECTHCALFVRCCSVHYLFMYILRVAAMSPLLSNM